MPEAPHRLGHKQSDIDHPHLRGDPDGAEEVVDVGVERERALASRVGFEQRFGRLPDLAEELDEACARLLVVARLIELLEGELPNRFEQGEPSACRPGDPIEEALRQE